MNKMFLLAGLFIFSTSSLFSQTLLAKWTFDTGTNKDSTATGGITANLTKVITAIGTSSINYSKSGVTTYSAQATQWDNGSGTKYWQIEFVSTGYDCLTISSKQESGGNYPGPRDFKLQFKVGSSGTWADVSNTILKVFNDTITGVLNKVQLPAACNQQSSVFLRWIMTSDTSSTGTIVAATGIDKIDDIYVYGKSTAPNSIYSMFAVNDISIYPNPVQEVLNISTSVPVSNLAIMDISGKLIYSNNKPSVKYSLNLESMKKGVYILKLNFGYNQNPELRKIVLE